LTVDSRQSAEFSRQSTVGSRQNLVVSQQSAVGSHCFCGSLLLCGMDDFSDVVKWKFLIVFFSKKNWNLLLRYLVLGSSELATEY
jgi:hypothetical protein